MSTTVTIGMSAWPVTAAKPSTAFVQPAQFSARWAQGDIVFRAAVEKIPRGATIIKAEAQLAQYATQAGAWTIRVHANTAPWPASLRWNTRPAYEASYGDQTRQPPTAGSWWSVNVTNAVQRMVSGQIPNRGFTLLCTSQTAWLQLKGPRAVNQQPRLVVTYTTVPPGPTGLSPDGAAVSPTKPVLLFTADLNITRLQVQVDANASASSPGFDSGEVVVTGGMLDLNQTAYPGLADGAATYWRVRQQTSGGWSAWSTWARFSRVAQSILTITSPTGTADADGNTPVQDGTPPVTWTLSGTQVAWQARLLAADGDPIADSRRTTGALTNWTPGRGLTKNGQVGIIEVQAWDDADRIATVDAPVQVIETRAIVLTSDGTITPFNTVTAESVEIKPQVRVIGYRAAIPDEVIVLADGETRSRVPGSTACEPAPGGGYVCRGIDPWPIMNTPQGFQLVPVVNGKRGPVGPTALYAPHTSGVWLVRANAQDEMVVILNQDVTQEQPETAVVHQPLGDNQVQQVVRRRLVRAAPQGSISGELADVPSRGWDAFMMAYYLRCWAENLDAGERFQLTLGGYSGLVIIGDVVVEELDHHHSEGNRFAVSLNWWAQR